MNKQDKIKKVMKEFKNGTLKTPDGKVVASRKQALAIAMSESEDYAEKADLIGQIRIDSVEEAEDIIKSAGTEKLFDDIEKAIQPGTEREYQGRIYVYGTTKSGKMGWKVKEKKKKGDSGGTSGASSASAPSGSKAATQIAQKKKESAPQNKATQFTSEVTKEYDYYSSKLKISNYITGTRRKNGLWVVVDTRNMSKNERMEFDNASQKLKSKGYRVEDNGVYEKWIKKEKVRPIGAGTSGIEPKNGKWKK